MQMILVADVSQRNKNQNLSYLPNWTLQNLPTKGPILILPHTTKTTSDTEIDLKLNLICQHKPLNGKHIFSAHCPNPQAIRFNLTKRQKKKELQNGW